MLLKRFVLSALLLLPGLQARLQAEEAVELAADQSCTSCSACDACSQECWDGGWVQSLLSRLTPSDRCYYNFISPMTNPVFFEDPRTLTEARAIFIQHRLPAAVGGNSIRVVAVQARAALTENLSVIATKDGFVFADPAAIVNDGWADVSAGLKYNLYKDPCKQQIISTGDASRISTSSSRKRRRRIQPVCNRWYSDPR